MNIIIPLRQQSYWLSNTKQTNFPQLTDTVEVDVVIVGGGIAGITTAYVLKKAGFTVAVLEKHTVASGATGGNTGKVTAQHSLVYADLVKQFGKKAAQTYADVYKQALIDIEQVVKQEKIACQWAKADNFVYTADMKNIKTFQEEANVAAGLGLPSTYETDLSLPFVTVGAVKFADQAMFNSAQYVQHLAELIHDERHNFVFEHTQATRIKEGQPCEVKTSKGVVLAKHIVIATKIPPSPLAARLTYAAVEYPESSYVIAGKTDATVKGMYISPDKEHFSILPIDGRILIGGMSHIPGLGDSERRQQKLADYAHKWFGVEEIEYRWKAMDYIAYDKLPVIGKLYLWSKNTYVTTGFKKWGLSTSMVAAHIIRDLLNGKETSESKLFDPHRFSAPLSIPRAGLEHLKQRLF